MKILSYSVAILALCGATFGGYVAFFKKGQTAVAAVPEKPIANVIALTPSALSDNMIVPGVVKSDGVVAVTTFSEGLVANCLVKLGQRVEKGQALCSVENDNPAATYLPFTVQAPAAGTIGEIHASVGTRVNKGDKIITILLSAKAKVEIEVPVQDAATLKVGTEGSWTPTGIQSKNVPVRIAGISPLPDMATRTVRIELATTKAEPGLPGALGKVTFVFNSRRGFEVAEESVQYRGTDSFIRTVVDGKVKWIPVVLGRKQKGKVEIVSGVTAGSIAVVNSAKFLADGDEVVSKSENIAKK